MLTVASQGRDSPLPQQLGGTTEKRFSGVVDPTSPNLARTEGDRRSTALLFQSSDIFVHFRTLAAQSCVMF